MAALRTVLDGHAGAEVQFHALRTRQAGPAPLRLGARARPGRLDGGTAATRCVDAIEEEIRVAIPGATVETHLEAIEDPAAWEDVGLDRSRPALRP